MVGSMSEPWAPLQDGAVDPDPLVQFGRWFDEAASVLASPEAMAVATAGPDGRPSVRMVLLKSWGEDGFVFHTNYASRKGGELAVNPVAALLFHWEPLGRQVRIEGTARAVRRRGVGRLLRHPAPRRARSGRGPRGRVPPSTAAADWTTGWPN